MRCTVLSNSISRITLLTPQSRTIGISCLIGTRILFLSLVLLSCSQLLDGCESHINSVAHNHPMAESMSEGAKEKILVCLIAISLAVKPMDPHICHNCQGNFITIDFQYNRLTISHIWYHCLLIHILCFFILTSHSLLSQKWLCSDDTTKKRNMQHNEYMTS